jgi:hypothetical protein
MAEQAEDFGAAGSLLGSWSDEAELVERAKTQPEAFGHLYDRYYSVVLNYVFRRTLDVALAEELTSNTFFNALRALGGYENRGKFLALSPGALRPAIFGRLSALQNQPPLSGRYD